MGTTRGAHIHIEGHLKVETNGQPILVRHRRDYTGSFLALPCH